MITFEISRNLLFAALLRLRHTLLKKSELPILDDFLFTIRDESLEIASSDGEIVTIETVNIGQVISIGIPRLRFAVHRYTFLRAIKATEEQVLTITVGDYQLEVKHCYGAFQVPIDDAAEYPAFLREIPDTDLCHVNMEAPGLAHWINLLYDSMADDELRPVMNGILFEMTDSEINLVSSEGHQLAHISKPDDACQQIKKTHSFIIPKKIVRILRNILPKTGKVEFDMSIQVETVPKGSIKIEIEQDRWFTILFRGIDGRYPNYRLVIPQNNNIHVTVERKTLMRSVDRLLLFACEANCLGRFDISEKGMEISSSWADYELSAHEKIDVEATGLNQPFRIGMNLSTQSWP